MTAEALFEKTVGSWEGTCRTSWLDDFHMCTAPMFPEGGASDRGFWVP